MAQILRETINGTTPQDIMKINNNTENIWFKIYGNLDFDDTNTQTQDKIQTQWIPFQGEGNMDKNYPLYIRFFAPPNIKKIKSSTLNAICERYRMDSGVARGGGGVENVEIAMSMQSSNVAVSTNASTNAIISTGLDSTSETSVVSYWGNYDPNDPENTGGRSIVEMRPEYLDFAYQNMPNISTDPNVSRHTIYETAPYGSSKGHTGGGQRFAPVYYGYEPLSETIRGWVDMNTLQHRHDMSHTHAFRLTQEPHKHDIALEPHTHNASGKINLEPHEHELNEGVKISSVSPQNVNVYVNNTKVTTLSESNATANNIDIANYVKIGEWNTIKIETTSLARCTIYGTLEAIMKR